MSFRCLFCVCCFCRDSFAYEKLRTKRHNKQGSFLLRESQFHYDELCLDVCLEEGQPATTFSVAKTPDGRWSLTGLEAEPCASIRELVATYNEAKLGIPGFELKECLPSSENDISELLLCRRDPIQLDGALGQQEEAVQLPFCIPAHSVQLYAGVGIQYEFSGRFTQVHRGVWRRNQDGQVQIVRKLLKPEFRQSFSQAFLESVQKAIFWRCETLVHIYGIILDLNLSLIMEHLPLGPLDEYLQENELPVIDLVEAATNLAKAMFYLVERFVKLSFTLPFNNFLFFHLGICRKRKGTSMATSAAGIYSLPPILLILSESNLPILESLPTRMTSIDPLLH